MLSNQEKIILKTLKKGIRDVSKISQDTGLEEVAVMRFALHLEEKNLAQLREEREKMVELTEEGRRLSRGIPEREILKKIGEKKDLSEIEHEEKNIVLGWLKKRGWIEFSKVNGKTFVFITPKGKKERSTKAPDEEILERLKDCSLNFDEIPHDVFKMLKKRKAVILKDLVKRRLVLTEEGKKLRSEELQLSEEISELTPQVLRSGRWREGKFKSFDIQAPCRRIYPGKRHFINQAIDYVRQIWLELGFKEMTGPMVSSSFWNFDALFQPQDHPARDMQDTFFVKNPRSGDLPAEELVERVRETHERGWKLESTGWGYEWNKAKAAELVLRTHTTVLSAKTLSILKKEELPQKFFSVGKCFRNEELTWKNAAEFYQTDGIVVSEDVNFRHLLGYLKRFLKKMGFKKIRFRPAYFPYTEPSVEAEVYHPEKKVWVELIGAGIFRPEVVVPLLGHDVPVLAWGPGFERIIMDYFEIKDIRDLYKNDLEQLKNLKIWRR